jgi:hypothetical protein
MRAALNRPLLTFATLSLFLAMALPVMCPSMASASTVGTPMRCTRTSASLAFVNGHANCTISARVTEAVNVGVQTPVVHLLAVASPRVDHRPADTSVSQHHPSPGAGPPDSSAP